MKMYKCIFATALLAVGIGIAQGPLNDRIIVKLPYPVSVNGTVLQPGEYEIRQHDSTAGGSRIVHFFSDQGMKFETTAIGINALDNKTPEETSLVLEHLDNDYYLNKIWVQGKNYGYEFPLPDSVKSREKERQSSSIVARYEATAPTSTTQTQTTEVETKTVTTAETIPARAPEVEKQQVPVEAAQVEQAQAAPAPAPIEAAPAPIEAAPAPVEAAPTPRYEAADRGSAMPETAGNWLGLLFGGGLLTGSGVFLRRFRA